MSYDNSVDYEDSPPDEAKGFGEMANIACDRIERMVANSPGAATAVTFAAGLGLGALIVHVLASSSARPDPFLARLGKQAMNSVQGMVPEQWASLLSKVPDVR